MGHELCTNAINAEASGVPVVWPTIGRPDWGRGPIELDGLSDDGTGFEFSGVEIKRIVAYSSSIAMPNGSDAYLPPYLWEVVPAGHDASADGFTTPHIVRSRSEIRPGWEVREVLQCGDDPVVRLDPCDLSLLDALVPTMVVNGEVTEVDRQIATDGPFSPRARAELSAEEPPE